MLDVIRRRSIIRVTISTVGILVDEVADTISQRRARLGDVAKILRPSVVRAEAQAVGKTLIGPHQSGVIVGNTIGRKLDLNVRELWEWAVLLQLRRDSLCLQRTKDLRRDLVQREVCVRELACQVPQHCDLDDDIAAQFVLNAEIELFRVSHRAVWFQKGNRVGRFAGRGQG